LHFLFNKIDGWGRTSFDGHRRIIKQENATVILLLIYITHQKNLKPIIKFEIFLKKNEKLKLLRKKEDFIGRRIGFQEESQDLNFDFLLKDSAFLLIDTIGGKNCFTGRHFRHKSF